MSIRELLFESLRWVDEHGDVDQALPIDAMSVRALAPPSASQPLLHRVILTLCADAAEPGAAAAVDGRVALVGDAAGVRSAAR